MNVGTQSEEMQSHDQRSDWDIELADAIVVPSHTWQEPGYNAARYASIGLLLGSIAGCTSLMLNVIGCVLWPAISGAPQHPLRLIQVYLTFPLGESALRLDSGMLLFLGCLLYLGTGMLYGMLFELVISYFLPGAGWRARLIGCSVLALFVWAMSFYAVLTWVQPLLFGGDWIVALIPWWVAALTHLAFGWTMALIYPLGTYGLSNPTSGTDVG